MHCVLGSVVSSALKVVPSLAEPSSMLKRVVYSSTEALFRNPPARDSTLLYKCKFYFLFFANNAPIYHSYIKLPILTSIYKSYSVYIIYILFDI